ncbi:host specificity J domain protein, partial [Escherichia coli EC1862]
PGACGTC